MIQHGNDRRLFTFLAALALAAPAVVAVAQSDESARQQRLAELGAAVESEQRGAHGRSIELRGSRLGTLDTSIDPADTAAVERETRRYLATIEDLVGPTAALDLGKFTLRHEPADEGAVDSVDVSFRQLVHDAPVGSGVLAVAANRVVRVRTTFVDAGQPNLDRDNWQPETAVEARARQEIRRHLSLDAVDAARFKGPGLSLRIVDDTFAVKPVYEYRYDDWGIHVDALTLETVIDERPVIPAS